MALKITNGPSREELFDALRLCKEGRGVEFTYINAQDKSESISLGINGIFAAGPGKYCDPGNGWIISGNYTIDGGRSFRGVKMGYSTKTHQGEIEFSKF